MIRAAAVLSLLAFAAPAHARERAPGAPGAKADWAPADKTGFGTAVARSSRVWFTLRGAAATEVFYPDLAHPSARGVTFWIDGRREAGAAKVEQADPAAPAYRQTVTAKGWRLTKTYVTDPARPALLVRVRFQALDGKAHDVRVRYDPSLYGGGDDDVGWTRGHALLAHDRHAASALAARPAFGRTSSGYAGASAGELGHAYDALQLGNVVQTAGTSLTGRPGHRDLTLALGFGVRATPALNAAAQALGAGFARVAAAYAAGWKRWRARLQPLPAAAVPYAQAYETSLQVLKASEDKATPGAFAPAPAAAEGGVRAADEYAVAAALLLAGDVDAADSALDVLFARFPKDPLGPVLAWQLARTDKDAWERVRRAADAIATGRPAAQPGTLAAQVAGLVCAADVARVNADPQRARRYLRTADAWQARVLRRSAEPGFLQLALLGVRRPDDPLVVNAVAKLHARLWHELGARGEYELLAGRGATAQLAALAGAGPLIPERTGRRPSATPFAWSHAQFVRLAWAVEAGRPLERPSLVAARYTAATP